MLQPPLATHYFQLFQTCGASDFSTPFDTWQKIPFLHVYGIIVPHNSPQISYPLGECTLSSSSMELILQQHKSFEQKDRDTYQQPQWPVNLDFRCLLDEELLFTS